MKIIGINGSPRKNWNTASLVSKALEGAASQGAETELVHLYDLDFKGCVSCFACKLKDSKSYGRCARQDGLTQLLDKIADSDALVLGSPIYLGAATGEMRSFLERLVFPYLVYDKERSTLFKKKIQVGMIYTMGVPENRMVEAGYDKQLKMTEAVVGRILGKAESMFVTDTLQFDDYSRYVATAFDPQMKLNRRRNEFPKDLERAFDMGARFAKGVE